MSPEDRPEVGEHERAGEGKAPDLRRQGRRRSSGADTPSGPNTDRTAIPAERERERLKAAGADVYPPDEPKTDVEEEDFPRDEEGEERQDLD